MENFTPEVINAIIAVVSFIIGLFTKTPKKRKK